MWPENVLHELAGCNYHGFLAKEIFRHDSRGFASWYAAKPSLAETQFEVEVKHLKCVMYELGKISSSVVAASLCGHDRGFWNPWTIGWSWVLTIRIYRVWEIFSAIRWSHVNIASPHVCTILLTWLPSDYWQSEYLGLCRFLPATLVCYSLRSQ